MPKSGLVTQADLRAHIDKPWQVVHDIYPRIRVADWGRVTGKPGAYPPVPHTHVKADITDTPWAWTAVSKTGSNLTDLATRQHAGLTNITSDQHHPQSHTLASHSTKPHSALTDISSDQHHPQSHTLASHSTKPHSALTDVTSGQHHAQLHAASHHVAGADLVNHDSLTGFLADEHIDWKGTNEHLQTGGYGVFGTGLYSQASGSSALKRIWAISQETYPNHGLFYVNTPLDAIEVRWDAVKMGEILLETGYIKGFPRIYFGTYYLSQLADANKVMDSDKVDGQHAADFALITTPLDNFGACSDIVLLNATTSKHGLLMKLGGGTVNFLRADGAWAAPTPAGHYASHELGGGDPIHHDSLTDFLADEHIDWKGTNEHLQTGGYGVFGTGLYSQASGSSALKRIWAISQATYPNHGLFYVNTPLDAIEIRWDGVKKGEILLETGYIKSFPRIYFGANYLSQLAASNKAMDSDKVDDEHASAIVTKARVDAQACDHGALVGRGDDDHSIYYNAARHTKAIHDALAILHSSLGGRTVNDHHDQAHTLASHSTKAHSELSDAPANAHHPQSHTLASHSTKAHSELSDAPASAHHPQLHAAAHHVGGGDLLAFASITGFGDYINQSVKTSYKPQFAGVNLGGATYYLGSGALASKLYTLYINEIYGDVGAVTDPTYTFNGDTNTGIYQGGADNLCFATGGGLRLRLSNTLATFSLPVVVADHGAAATDQVVNVCYGTGNPPTATGTTIGTLFVKYIA